jgi:hypothetical protein
LMILRSPPRPASNRQVRLVQAPRLVEGPRPVSRAAFKAERQASASQEATVDFASGWQRYLFAPGAADGSE